MSEVDPRNSVEVDPPGHLVWGKPILPCRLAVSRSIIPDGFLSLEVDPPKPPCSLSDDDYSQFSGWLLEVYSELLPLRVFLTGAHVSDVVIVLP